MSTRGGASPSPMFQAVWSLLAFFSGGLMYKGMASMWLPLPSDKAAPLCGSSSLMPLCVASVVVFFTGAYAGASVVRWTDRAKACDRRVPDLVHDQAHDAKAAEGCDRPSLTKNKAGAGRCITTVHKITQSQCTYKRKWSKPEFRVLAEESHGGWTAEVVQIPHGFSED